MSCVPVSVIIPNYNHATYLPLRLSSIANQTCINYEAILLDDASNDNSVSILNSFLSDTRFHLHRNNNNSGSTFAQWNKGVSLASNEYIWIAESDDIADNFLLESLVKKMEIDSEIVLAYCQSNHINENNEVTGTWKDFTTDLEYSDLFDKDFVMNGKEYISKFLIHRNTIPNASAVLLRKSVFQKVGGAPEHLITSGDWLTWLKMLCFGKVAFVAAPLNYFRRHNLSVIAKADTFSDDAIYKEQYQMTMRIEFKSFIQYQGISVSKQVITLNDLYISNDIGNKGLFIFSKGQLLKGIVLILKSSFSPYLRTGFLKKII